jgi:hypothetical protein
MSFDAIIHCLVYHKVCAVAIYHPYEPILVPAAFQPGT